MSNLIALPDGTTREATVEEIAQFEAAAVVAKQKRLEANKRAARAERTMLLRQSDWVSAMAFETGKPIPEEWATYRQALRDVPQQPGFPENIQWPAQPE